MLAALFEEVQKGNSLAESMGALPGVFPNLLVSMFKAVEMSGKLEETLIRMADYYEKEKKRRGQIKSATSYPKNRYGDLSCRRCGFACLDYAEDDFDGVRR
ncbi:MAG: type II secretion system F family protein [Clostridiales bacterium]|nr:MAG: type II secretion system F family protein [Clostridiales bacterium]